MKSKYTNIEILGICERHWSYNGNYSAENFRVIHRENDKSSQRRCRVEITVKEKWKNNILIIYVLTN